MQQGDGEPPAKRPRTDQPPEYTTSAVPAAPLRDDTPTDQPMEVDTPAAAQHGRKRARSPDTDEWADGSRRRTGDMLPPTAASSLVGFEIAFSFGSAFVGKCAVCAGAFC